MEYSLISFDEYNKCKNIAKQILRSSSHYSHRDIAKLRGPNIINSLNSKYMPNAVIYYSCNDIFVNKKHYLDYWNNMFDMNNIYLRIHNAIELDDIFIQTVSGMTTFDSGHRPLLFLNASNNIQRMIFTLLHEFIHLHQAERRSADYMQALAMINLDRMSGTSYPEELQPVEDEANTVASLLVLPDSNLNKDIHNLSFNELRDKYQISSSGLYNRLRSFFYYTKDFDEYEANQAAHAFSINDHKLIYYVRKHID